MLVNVAKCFTVTKWLRRSLRTFRTRGWFLGSSLTAARTDSWVDKWSTSFGWGYGVNVASGGWQVKLYDPIWHTSSRSSVMSRRIEDLFSDFTSGTFGQVKSFRNTIDILVQLTPSRSSIRTEDLSRLRMTRASASGNGQHSSPLRTCFDFILF